MISKTLTPRPVSDPLKDINVPSDSKSLNRLYDKSMGRVKEGLENNVYETGSLPERREFTANVLASRIAGNQLGKPCYDIVEHEGKLGFEMQAPEKSPSLEEQSTVHNDRLKAAMSRFSIDEKNVQDDFSFGAGR